VGQYEDRGVESISAGQTVASKANRFVYEDSNRIVEIYGPAEQDALIPTVWYEYADDFGNLTAVHKLVQKGSVKTDSHYETIKYIYEGPQYNNEGVFTHSYAAKDHYIVDIEDPRGLKPIRYQYDEAGKLIATLDAKGNKIELLHDTVGKTETVVDRSGNKTDYYYNNRGNVVKVINYEKSDDGFYTSISETDYAYGDSNNPDRPTMITQTPREDDDYPHAIPIRQHQ
jgi:YD repeat-containing protein